MKYENISTQDGSYEVRRYSAANWTSTDVSAVNMDLKSSDAFWRLFKYIGGANTGSEIKFDTNVIHFKFKPN